MHLQDVNRDLVSLLFSYTSGPAACEAAVPERDDYPQMGLSALRPLELQSRLLRAVNSTLEQPRDLLRFGLQALPSCLSFLLRFGRDWLADFTQMCDGVPDLRQWIVLLGGFHDLQVTVCIYKCKCHFVLQVQVPPCACNCVLLCARNTVCLQVQVTSAGMTACFACIWTG